MAARKKARKVSPKAKAGLKKYQAFIKAAKARGLTHKQAVAAWKASHKSSAKKAPKKAGRKPAKRKAAKRTAKRKTAKKAPKRKAAKKPAKRKTAKKAPKRKAAKRTAKRRAAKKPARRKPAKRSARKPAKRSARKPLMTRKGGIAAFERAIIGKISKGPLPSAIKIEEIYTRPRKKTTRRKPARRGRR